MLKFVLVATLLAIIIVGLTVLIAHAADLPIPRKPLIRAELKREAGPAPKYVPPGPAEPISRPAGTP